MENTSVLVYGKTLISYIIKKYMLRQKVLLLTRIQTLPIPSTTELQNQC